MHFKRNCYEELRTSCATDLRAVIRRHVAIGRDDECPRQITDPCASTRKTMKWAHHANLRKRPRTPAKGRGSVQRAIRRAFAASGTEALTSSAIYDWAHTRRRLGRRTSMPFGVYSRTLRTLRAMCDPIERVPPHGAWLWRLRDDVAARWR